MGKMYSEFGRTESNQDDWAATLAGRSETVGLTSPDAMSAA